MNEEIDIDRPPVWDGLGAGFDPEEGDEFLLPTTLLRRAHGGGGYKFTAIRIEVTETNIRIDDSTQKTAEGIYD